MIKKLDVDGVLELLFSCETSEEVYNQLRALNATGIPKNPWNCPVANALTNAITNEDYATIVIKPGLIVFTDSRGFWKIVRPTEAIRSFIRKFDDREYPDLIEEISNRMFPLSYISKKEISN